MLRAIYGFDHCAVTGSPTPGGGLTPFLPGLGYNVSTIGASVLAVDQDGFIGGYSLYNANTGGTEGNITFNMTGLFPKPPTVITIGFRLKPLAVPKGAKSILSLTWPGNANPAAAFLFSTALPANPWMPAAGATCYVEITYTVATRTVTGVVNGIPVTLTPGPNLVTAQIAGLATAMAAGTWGINFQLTDYYICSYGIRDVYVLDSTPGDGFTAPIGDQRMYLVTPSSATGAEWVSSTGQALVDTLNVALPAVANISSPIDKTPLALSMSSTAPRGTDINAVSMMLSGSSNGAGNLVNKIDIAQGSNTLPSTFVAVSADPTLNKPIGLYTKAPDGGLWDSAKLSALTVTLTPNTSV